MATINDVAKRAGVSRGTVSNVINHAKVRPEYKEKVEKAIEELGYIPNAYARSLKSNKTNTVAFILPTVWFPFFAELTNDIERELRTRGYKMLLCNSHNDYRLELEYVNMARENKVDGILAITYSDLAPYLSGQDIPLVTMERYFSEKIPFVSTDNFQGGVMVAERLVSLGCRKPAFIGRMPDESGVVKLRRDGFVSYCREHGIEFGELCSAADSGAFVEEVYDFVRQNYSGGVTFDGLFTATDRYGEYVVDALERYRCPVRAGENLQLIGFDGERSHEHDITRISSMRQPVEEIAAFAVDTLCRMMNKEKIERYKLFSAVFVQGKTTRRV